MKPEVPVNSSFKRGVGDKQPEARISRDMTTCRAIVLFCVALIVIALCAPLLMTLPRTLDAALRPVSAVGEASASESSLPEQSSGVSADSWVDTMEEGEIAQWRMRASD
jgi:hypothetical protein